MKSSNATILLILILVFTSVGGASDLKSGFCNNDEFLKCVGAAKEVCEKSYFHAERDCLEKYPIDADAGNDEAYGVAEKYGECFTSSFIRGLSAAENKFDECGKHLESTFREYKQNAEQAQQLNEERLEEREAPHYQ